MKIKYKFTLENIPAILRYAGIRPTVQRVAIGQFIFLDGDHPSVEEIKQAVDQRFPGISLATVYNTVHTLEEVGLLQAIHPHHGDKIVYDRKPEAHHHFIDLTTGKMEDIPLHTVQLNHEALQDYQISEMEVYLKGEHK